MIDFSSSILILWNVANLVANFCEIQATLITNNQTSCKWYSLVHKDYVCSNCCSKSMWSNISECQVGTFNIISHTITLHTIYQWPLFVHILNQKLIVSLFTNLYNVSKHCAPLGNTVYRSICLPHLLDLEWKSTYIWVVFRSCKHVGGLGVDPTVPDLRVEECFRPCTSANPRTFLASGSPNK